MTVLPQSVGDNPSSGQFTGTRSPSTGTLAATPAVGDLVIFAAKCDGTGLGITLPSGWFSLLGGTGVIDSGGHCVIAIGHWYTSGELAANTRAWTLTNLFNTNQNGRRGISVFRGVDPTTPVGSLQSATATSATLNFPTMTPAVDNSLTYMLGAGSFSATSRTYTAPPAPWVDLGSTLSTGGTTRTLLHYYHPTANVAGSPVDGPDLTINGSDQWIGILLELMPIPDAPAADQGDFFAMF